MKKKYYKAKSTFTFKTNFVRVLWSIVYYLLFKFSPIYFFRYRRIILIIFGAKIDKDVDIYPSVKIWLPSNLSVKKASCLGRNVNVYNQGFISIGKNTIIYPGVRIYNNSVIGNNCIIHSGTFVHTPNYHRG